MTAAASSIDDLQRGIRLAFAVPETHVASALGYLMRGGPALEQFSAEICGMFHALATPQGSSLCAGLLKIRLELRAAKLRQTRDVDSFWRLLERQSRV